MFRLLQASEIEARVGRVNAYGASLLLYKDARADMKILDETVTPMGWQRRHEIISGRLYCTVSIMRKDGVWVEKQDVGTESNTEAIKGEASDAFKRACVNWGIGRELYTAPDIWITKDKIDIKAKGAGFTTFERFKVIDIAYNVAREICYLVIARQTKTGLEIVYQYGQKPTA